MRTGAYHYLLVSIIHHTSDSWSTADNRIDGSASLAATPMNRALCSSLPLVLPSCKRTTVRFSIRSGCTLTPSSSTWPFLSPGCPSLLIPVSLSALQGLVEGSITKMVVMDHMDWFDPNAVRKFITTACYATPSNVSVHSPRAQTVSWTPRLHRCIVHSPRAGLYTGDLRRRSLGECLHIHSLTL